MYYLSNFLANVSLMMAFLINSHLFALVIPILLISIGLLLEIGTHYREKKYKKTNPDRKI